MDVTSHFRQLLKVVDPAALTGEDRAALLDLVARCLDCPPAGGGGRRQPA